MHLQMQINDSRDAKKRCSLRWRFWLATFVIGWGIAALFTFTAPALATGWHDYELPISPQHSILRANSLDVMLCRGRSIILVPRDYPDVGPIVEYSVGSSHIFTRHIGRKPRNLFTDDTFEELDYPQEFFFVVDRSSDTVSGPFSSAQFQVNPKVSQEAPIQWEKPRNPNIVIPILGSLIFLAFSVVIFGWPLLLLALLVAVVFIVARRWKRPKPPAAFDR